MNRILIAVPTYENIYPDTFKAIYQLDKGSNEADFDFFRGYDVANARNKIAKATVERGYDYVLTIDNDIVPPRDALLNLLETEQSYHEHCMAVGYCLRRSKANSGITTAFKFGAENYKAENAYTGDELKALRANGVTRVQLRGSGLACALIHRSVFERMEYPYFKWVLYSNGEQLSEDLCFCGKFAVKQLPIFVDTRVPCGHLMRYIGNI